MNLDPILLDEPIEVLDKLSTKILNLLRRNHINTIGDLRFLTEERLRGFKNVGDKAVQDIREAMLDYGLKA